jgi:predicted Rossmann fold flavoprotein
LTPLKERYDVIIIGAGASGLMCSAQIGYQGQSVLVIDHAPKAAVKIRISGGGKCNFTNQDVGPNNFICQNPHFVKSALSRYSSAAFIELVDRHGLEYEQRELGKLFCLHRASDLIQILRTECDWAGVEFLLNTPVVSIKSMDAEDRRYQLVIQSPEGMLRIDSQSLVVATGALSFPKLKASAFGYQIAQQFGIAQIPTRPGLVPLNFEGKWLQRFKDLTGYAFEARVCANGHCFDEALLMTHQGLSGPGILQASNFWQEGEAISINPFFKVDLFAELKQLKATGKPFSSWLSKYWTKRMAQAWLSWFPLDSDLANVADARLKAYADQCQQWTLYPAKTGGYAKAEVTLGGVDTNEISSKTMESKRQPGLYFIGEVLDVTGQLGGYNFQWAWSSAVACANALNP